MGARTGSCRLLSLAGFRSATGSRYQPFVLTRGQRQTERAPERCSKRVDIASPEHRRDLDLPDLWRGGSYRNLRVPAELLERRSERHPIELEPPRAPVLDTVEVSLVERRV